MKSTIKTQINNISIMCMSPEARELLDTLCKEFKALYGKEIWQVNGYQALYWAIRHSSLQKRIK